MKTILALPLLVVLSGCLDPSAFQSADTSSDPPPQAAPPPAAAPAGDPALRMGEGLGIHMEREAPAAAPRAAAPAGAAAAALPPGEHLIPDIEAVIVEKRRALAENPNYRETETKISAGDPLSAASQSYFALGQRVHLLNFKHDIDLYRAEHDRYPSYEEFISRFRQFDVRLKHLKPWQVYAYDQTDGTFVVLEDLAEKRRRYEAAGLEYRD